jgi:hypothetical protein
MIATKFFRNRLSLKPDDLASKLMIDRIDMLEKENTK